MREAGYGRLVFTSSNAGTFGNFGQSVYGAAKAALIGLSGAVAIEVDDDGHFQSRRVRHLRQKHRAEFAGADHADAERLGFGRAGQEHAMKAHCFLLIGLVIPRRPCGGRRLRP